MNLGFSPLMSLNLSSISLPASAKASGVNAAQFPQTLALVQAVPTSQVTPVTQVPAVTAGTRGESAFPAPAIPANQTSTEPTQSSFVESTVQRDPVDEFRKYMAMSPAEKMRYAVLADAGLTMEEYQELPPEEKEKIDAEIAERMKEMREARELNNNQTKAIAHYQLAMQHDQDEEHRAHPTSIFV